jgi:vacuolar protein sorting-associated protein 29
MSNQTELVLVIGDINIPFKCPDIPEQYKNILIPGKIQHVLSLGNIGSRETYDWLKSLSGNFHAVKGEIDEYPNLPETKIVQIGDFKIGMIHGHQVIPWGDPEALANIQRQLGCDILLSGHTHINNISLYDGKYFINPGSITGSVSPIIADTVPSFVLMVIQGDYAIIYLYEIYDSNKKFEVSKLEFTKNSNELKESKKEEGGDDDEVEEVELQEEDK